MKFSYQWLQDLAPGLSSPAVELGRLITMKTAECEGVEEYAPHLAAIRAARVLSTSPAGKNVAAVIDAGPLGQRTVVCGAPNCRPGIVTAYVPPGTKLGGRTIGKAAIQGVESEGMLASGAELELNRDHQGILELDLEPGASLPFSPDAIIEIDNKSLTHRPDLWGHFGMAREVSAITGVALRDPVDMGLLPKGPAAVEVSIEDATLCPRYSALVFENVNVQPSPLWLQYRLQAVGLNPINNIVDVTNYLMAELAQPAHAFDADRVQGAIRVRSASGGEEVQALNGETYKLNPANLVIADAGGAIAIAGVIGGMSSAIHAGTQRLILESANFQAASVRKTSSALRLRTDASMRFEKSQDPANTIRALARAIDLLRQVCPGIRLVGGVADVYYEQPKLPPISLSLDWLDRKLGRAVPEAEVIQILRSLEFGVSTEAERRIRVTVPSWRATKDVSIKDDLVEEVGRMIGYGSIAPTAPLQPVRVPPDPDQARRRQHREVRDMAAAQGFDEVYNYSFLSDETVQRFQFLPEAHLRLLNPIAADQNLMRTSLIPGIWKNAVENARFSDAFRLFEMGREIHPRAGDLPRETTRLAALIYSKDGGEAGLFELKRLAGCIAGGIEVQAAGARPFEHPARVANLAIGNRTIGRLFEFHPGWIEAGRAAVLDLDLDALLELGKKEVRFQPIRRFPSSAFDLSVITGAREPVGSIERKLASLAGSQLEAIRFLRRYSGPPLAEGFQSVSFRLTVSSPDRTLSADDVASARAKVIEGMQSLGYELRV